jgi:hypothetical protein
LPSLKFLDSTPVTVEEQKQARKVGPYSLAVRVDASELQRQQQQQPPPEKADDINALPQDLQEEGKGQARIGVTQYVSGGGG